MKKEKDTVSPKVLLDRINRAALVANWNTDEENIRVLPHPLILRDRALVWWETLEDSPNDNQEVWADVKKEFLAAYAPRFTAKTTCTNFQEMVQRSNENVHDYFLRVSKAFKKMCEAKPIDILKKEGITDSKRFFQHQLFIAGLKEEIRMKIMEDGKTSIQESVTLARELEVIHEDRKKGHMVGVISSNPNTEDNNLDEEDLAAINAVQFQRGKPLMRGFQQSPGNFNLNKRSNPNRGGQQLPRSQ